jgi:uncharacterized protein YndB with AHSA1/START domain/DNA-binding transcriptional ArsR family regulator
VSTDHVPTLDRVFHTLADPTRRRLVERLVRGPASVSSLAEPFDMSLSAVMQHLQVLLDGGLASSEKLGRVRTWRVEPTALRLAEDWLSGRRTTWERRLDRLDLLLTTPKPTTRGANVATRSVVHSSFTLEREYRASPDEVFAAWSDPATKGRWFAGEQNEHHELDFRVGGREVTLGRNGEGQKLAFESWYHDIVPEERIVYSSTLALDDAPVTVSVTTVLFEKSAAGTTLLLTEQDTFLDGHEEPQWREQGTGAWLDALGQELAGR